MAYLPTAAVSVGLAAGLKMGSAPGASFGASPGLRPDFERSSSHMAHGQASRRKGTNSGSGGRLSTRCVPVSAVSSCYAQNATDFTDLHRYSGLLNKSVEISKIRGQ